MKWLRKLLWAAGTLLVLHLLVVWTGHAYLYKGIANTYLKGQVRPDIDEFRIFDNRIIKPGTPQPWPEDESYNKNEPDASLLATIDSLKTVAFLVIKDGKLCYERYREDYTDSTPSNSFSMAKTFTSVLCGCAIGDGSIKSEYQRISEFIPGYDQGLAKDLRIIDLLTMSSGIGFDEGYTSPFAYPAKAYYGSDLWALTASYQVEQEPGKYFSYLSGNTVILGALIAKATGMDLADYLTEKIWKPCGAEQPAWWSLDRKGGMEKAFCCINSNAGDFARLGQLYLDSGRWHGKQIVPEDYVLRSIQPAPIMEQDGSDMMRYGYGWWLTRCNEHKVFYARGILGQYIIVMPDLKIVIIRLGHKRKLGKGIPHPADMDTYVEAALQICRINDHPPA